MNRRQRNEGVRFVTAHDWANGRAEDFAASKPKVKEKYTATVAKLAVVITDLGGKAALQAGGAFGEETGNQEVLRADVEDVLREINRAAAAVAEEQENPSIMSRFRMPRGVSDEELRTKLRAFATAIEELALAEEFEALGEETTPADLRQMADDFVGSEGDQATALSERVGAGQAIPGIIRRGRAAVKTLGVMVAKRYKGDIETLAAWKSASHLKRDAKPKDEEPEKPPAAPNP